jgi:hypothetical protein
MNFTQTKGREADATLLVFEEDDFFGREAKPFPEGSRLLSSSGSTAPRHRLSGPYGMIASSPPSSTKGASCGPRYAKRLDATGCRQRRAGPARRASGA